ncbi:Cytochrome P450 71A6 (Fragment) [Linum grandiflorum]
MWTQQLEEITSSLDSFSLLCLLGCLLLLLFFSKWLLFPSPRKNQLLPPSPFKLPILGNLHQLGSHPHRSLHSMSQTHGPIMLLHLGQSPTLVISSPESAKEILKTHDLHFSNRTDSIIARRLLYNYKDLSLSPYGEYWRQMRSICVMQLLSTKRVHSFRRVREEEASLMVDRILEMRHQSVDLGEMFSVLTEDVISRVAFGKKYRKLKGMLKEMAVLLGIFNVADFVPWMGWINRFNGLNARVERVFAEFDQFLDEVVDEHITRRRMQGNTAVDETEEEQKDFVDVLLDAQEDNELMDRDSIKAIILDMFGAGSDTTFTALEWAMTEVLKHPRVTNKLQQEIRSVVGNNPTVKEEDIERMPYLKAVIKESLRLHPPIPLLVPRASTKDTNVLGYDIAAKTGVLINAWAIGRDPTAWEDPAEFRPERFMVGSSSSVIDYKGQDFQLIPFGAGRRGCPGITFAAAVLEIAMAALLHRFDWTFPGGSKAEDLDVSEAPGMAVQRQFPLLVIATPFSLQE